MAAASEEKAPWGGVVHGFGGVDALFPVVHDTASAGHPSKRTPREPVMRQRGAESGPTRCPRDRSDSASLSLDRCRPAPPFSCPRRQCEPQSTRRRSPLSETTHTKRSHQACKECVRELYDVVGPLKYTKILVKKVAENRQIIWDHFQLFSTIC